MTWALSSTLRDFQVDLAGKLVMLEAPGSEVKALREKYGFTQEHFATLLDLRRESLSRIESGHVALSLDFLQRFVRLVTLVRGVREHLAFVEARDNQPDEGYLSSLGVSLRVPKELSDEIIVSSMINYEAKRKQALRSLQGR